MPLSHFWLSASWPMPQSDSWMACYCLDIGAGMARMSVVYSIGRLQGWLSSGEMGSPVGFAMGHLPNGVGACRELFVEASGSQRLGGRAGWQCRSSGSARSGQTYICAVLESPLGSPPFDRLIGDGSSREKVCHPALDIIW